ncbi:MAG: hypothetical protein EWV88_11165, partial [Microcystis wesenbergii Mw_MB_S_20031200_S109D]
TPHTPHPTPHTPHPTPHTPHPTPHTPHPTPHTLLYKTSSYLRAGKGNTWARREGKREKY